MSRPRLLLALRYLLLTVLVALMAATGSGVIDPGAWFGLSKVGLADARGLSPFATDIGRIVAEADNGPVCDPRPSPRLQTVSDAAGALQVTITAATGSDGEPATLREIRIGPLQNAAVDVGPFAARTTPLAYTLPAGSLQLTFRVTRVVPGQPSQVTLLLVDDCGDWRTFVGGRTGLTIAPSL